MTPSLQRLLPRHYKIVELALAGYNAKHIAQVLNMNPRSVSMVLQSPLVQHELSKRREAKNESQVLGLDRDATIGRARMVLERAVESAAKTQVKLLECEDPSIQLKAADRILDRVFGKADTQRQAVVNITAEQVNLLVAAMKESQDGEVL